MTRLQTITDRMVQHQDYQIIIALERRKACAAGDSVVVIYCDVLAAEERDRLAIWGARLVQHPAANDATTMPGAA